MKLSTGVILASFLQAAAPAVAQDVQSAAPGALGVIAWPPDAAAEDLDRTLQVEQCLIRALRLEAPRVVVVSSTRLRDALFPLLEPATIAPDPDALSRLFTRQDVLERLRSHGLHYLVAVSARKREEGYKGAMLCGQMGCVGFMWQGESSVMEASLWRIDGEGAPPARYRAETEGTTIVPAWGLPIPLVTFTDDRACRKVAAHFSAFMRTAPPSVRR